MEPSTPPMRRGITLLEVLISLGILAVGLTSVLSLIPAGKAFSARGMSADQAANLTENALADAITFGLTNINSLTTAAGGSPPASPIIIDPVGIVTGGSWPAALGLNAAYLKAGGTLSGTAAASVQPRTTGALGLFFHESRDDVAYTPPPTEDDFPTNKFIDGVRAYVGQNTWIAMLTSPAGGSFSAGDQATLSIVTFAKREMGLIPPSTLMTNPVYLNAPSESLSWTAGATLVPDRENKEVVRPGAYFLIPTSPPSFRRVVMADLWETNNGATVQFEGEAIPTAVVGRQWFLIPDATSVTDYTVTIEGSSDYTK